MHGTLYLRQVYSPAESAESPHCDILHILNDPLEEGRMLASVVLASAALCTVLQVVSLIIIANRSGGAACCALGAVTAAAESHRQGRQLTLSLCTPTNRGFWF